MTPAKRMGIQQPCPNRSVSEKVVGWTGERMAPRRRCDDASEARGDPAAGLGGAAQAPHVHDPQCRMEEVQPPQVSPPLPPPHTPPLRTTSPTQRRSCNLPRSRLDSPQIYQRLDITTARIDVTWRKDVAGHMANTPSARRVASWMLKMMGVPYRIRGGRFCGSLYCAEVLRLSLLLIRQRALLVPAWMLPLMFGCAPP